MDVRISTPPAPHPPAAPTTPAGQGAAQNDVTKRVTPPEDVKTENRPREDQPKAKARAAPLSMSVRVELMVDEATSQVFGRVVDRKTGDELRQIPAEDIRRLQAITREMFGTILDETV